MAFKLNIQAVPGSGVPTAQIPVTVDVADADERRVSATLPANQTNHAVATAFAHTKLLACLIYSTVPMTLETNDGGTPIQTFPIGPDKPLVWASGMPNANPFTSAVTGFFLTNVLAGEFVAYLVVDPT